MAKILIIFGSTTGNTEIVCEKVAETFRESGHEALVQRVELSKPEDCHDYDLCVLASPTYGHGELQEHVVKFFNQFLQEDFTGQKFAIIALGDYKYYRFFHLTSSQILQNGIKKVGGELTSEPLLISKSPVPHLDTKITEWTNKISAQL